jgi:RimJ/RimL family protein N-acetyltransferase
VTRLIGGPCSPEQVRSRLEVEIANHDQHGTQYWPLFLLATGEFVGCCGLRPYHVANAVHEFGFHLCRAHWGQGYAQEAGTRVIRHAFGQCRAAALFAGHHPDNAASRAILLKLGFRYTHNEYYRPTGLHHPSYLLRREDALSP